MSALNLHDNAVKVWAGISLSSSFVTLWNFLPTALAIITAILTIVLTSFLIIGQRKKNQREDLEIKKLLKEIGESNATN